MFKPYVLIIKFQSCTYVPSNSFKWYFSSMEICLSGSRVLDFFVESFLPKRGIFVKLVFVQFSFWRSCWYFDLFIFIFQINIRIFCCKCFGTGEWLRLWRTWWWFGDVGVFTLVGGGGGGCFWWRFVGFEEFLLLFILFDCFCVFGWISMKVQRAH